MSDFPLGYLDLKTSNAEIVLGLVSPVGTNIHSIQEIVEDRLKAFSYDFRIIGVSDLIRAFDHLKTRIEDKSEQNRLKSLMDAGNELRHDAKRGDVLAIAAINKIQSERDELKPFPRRAYLVRSLKHPDEVTTLRRVYGDGFFLIGVFASEEDRLKYLTEDKQIPNSDATSLMERDTEEADPFGQQTRKTFHLADMFIHYDADETKRKNQIWRILDLIFGYPFITPSIDEYGMYLAYASSLRSADLSRQVGAVIISSHGEVIATGANDVPKAFGGLYWPDDSDARDHTVQFGYDSNAKMRNEIIEEILKKLGSLDQNTDKSEQYRQVLLNSPISDITEYGRVVHAEMAALLSCARVGVSVANATLYTTTYPCHNCAKHIIASGIKRIVYVEPYSKSKALELHPDSLSLGPVQNEENPGKVVLEPFLGIGPRRYLDLFSMKIGSGYPMIRKKQEDVVEWDRSSAQPRIPMLPGSYLEHEVLVAQQLNEILKKKKEVSNE